MFFPTRSVGIAAAVGVGVGVLVGFFVGVVVGVEFVFGALVVGAGWGPTPAKSAMSDPTSTITRTPPNEMSGHVHGLRFLG
jgi:hypothetical protein